MNFDELITLKEYYGRIVREVSEKLQFFSEVEGTIRVSVNGNKIRYYHHSDQYEDKEKYVCKKDIALAKAVAQKNYYQKVLAISRKRLRNIEILLREYKEFEIDSLYDELIPAKKALVVPIEKTIQQKYEEWLNEEYLGKEFRDGTPLILSEKGERVRSKSEKLIADYLFRNNIEYKYERPLYLKGYGNIYPDFTLFSKKTGKEIYWEHDGKMDNPDYARKAVNKIEAYENSGIYLGEQLIVTFETSEKVLGTKEIEKIVQRFLIS